MRRSDKITLGAALLALVLIAGFYVVAHRPRALPPPLTRALPTTPGYYLGVTESGVIGSYQPIDIFASAVGRQPNLVLYYSAWGDPFETGLADKAHDHGAVTFVQLDPNQNTPMKAVADGKYDAYLRSYASQVRAFHYPVVVGFAPEMNGDWDSWGWRHTRPAVWVAAWRHVVTVFRQAGATNVTWIWTLNAGSNGTGPIQQWWPGARYVTWVGIDGYYFYSASTFTSTFTPTLNDVRALAPGKPVLLSETGIGQVAGQARKIPDLFAGMRAAGVLGLVWFDKNQDQGIYHQQWRLEGHPASLKVFRKALETYS
ncbi:MAG TPA: glycosyl hydrolase [Streptosporangiaceae bacterium]|nr:glycosyl hydrolase [Streptosporangiaceae bacterium]